MKFGVIPPYGVAPVESGAFARGFGRLAEACGLESVWVVEHVVMAVEYRSVYPYDPSGRSPFTPEVAQPDPLVWLGYVAAATERLRLATGVLNLPQRNPLVLAKEVASLDRLSDGRLELGIGMGWVREEADAVGTSFDDRCQRADEWVEVMRTLWREPVASFAGRWVRFRDVVAEPRPIQPGGVPIIVGGHTKAAARRAGRLGNGFYPMGVSVERLAELRTVLAETAAADGRDPAAIPVTCLGTPDLAAAERWAAADVDRMVIAAFEPTLDAIRPRLEAFARDVVERM